MKSKNIVEYKTEPCRPNFKAESSEWENGKKKINPFGICSFSTSVEQS